MLFCTVVMATGRKCRRCKKIGNEPGTDNRYYDLCVRCADVVDQFDRDYPGAAPALKPCGPVPPWVIDGGYARRGVSSGYGHYEVRLEGDDLEGAEESRRYWMLFENTPNDEPRPLSDLDTLDDFLAEEARA